MNYLDMLPNDILKLIYINVFNEVIIELKKFNNNKQKIDLTVKRCNFRINKRRCCKKIRTRFLIGNLCSYHYNLIIKKKKLKKEIEN